MKFKSLLIAVVLLLTLAVGAFGQTGEAAKPEAKENKGAPKLTISKTQHDFGQLKRGTLAQYGFTFKNEGTADLVINNVAPS